MKRTLSVRVEVVIEHDDADDLARIREYLAQRAKTAILASPSVVQVYEASSVLRMQEGPRW